MELVALEPVAQAAMACLSRCLVAQDGANIPSQTQLGGTTIQMSGSVSGAGVALEGTHSLGVAVTTPRICHTIPRIPGTPEVCTPQCLPEVCIGGCSTCGLYPACWECCTPRTCTQLCGANHIADICVPGTPGTPDVELCTGGDHIGSFSSIITARVAQNGAHYSGGYSVAISGNLLGGATLSGASSINVDGNRAELCQDIGLPAVAVGVCPACHTFPAITHRVCQNL